MPVDMGWDEAIGHIRILRRDPSSQIATAVEGWDYPLTREAAVLMDVWDLEYAKSGAKKREEYPRPFKKRGASRTERIGDAAGRTSDEVVAWLQKLGHKIT